MSGAEVEASSGLAQWVQAGGVLAFAGAVWFELRRLRPIMDSIHATLAALLERDRMRGRE